MDRVLCKWCTSPDGQDSGCAQSSGNGLVATLMHRREALTVPWRVSDGTESTHVVTILELSAHGLAECLERDIGSPSDDHDKSGNDIIDAYVYGPLF